VQRLSLFILIPLLFVSCADLKKSEQLERIDAMETQLSEWKTILNEFDAAVWNDRYVASESTVNQLKQLESDTISLEAAVSLDMYRSIQTKIYQITSQQRHYLTFVDRSEKRLKKLRADIESGSGQRHKYDIFLATEEEQMATLRSGFTSFESTFKEVESQFPDVQELVNRIIAEQLPETAVQ
jgi:chromosome segregation ATPase